jgi:two-component system response regulator YesN
MIAILKEYGPMRLLIADDDDYTRLGLMESIDWTQYGINEIKEAKDGAEALQIAEVFHPDIVLTDIRMPKLNGIEFAEKLAVCCGESKLLFMSGYMDIDYLKSAIKLSAVDYIEKPIKLNDLETAIKKTVEFIYAKQKQQHIINQNIVLQRQKLAGMLKSKNMNITEVIPICKETQFPVDYTYMCIVFLQVTGEEIQDSWIASINAYWNSYRIPSLVTVLENNKYLLIVAVKKHDRKRIRYLIDLLLKQNEGWVAGVGKEAFHLENVPESYNTAWRALDNSFYHPNQQLFSLELCKSAPQGLGIDLYPKFYSILKNDPAKLAGWMDSVCNQFCEFEYPRKERVCELFTSFAQAIIREKSSLLNKMNAIFNTDDLELYIHKCRSIFAIKHFMQQLLKLYMEELEDSSQYSRVVRDVREYIASHCSNVDLDVSEVAESVHLSTAHLGVLFKNETSVTIKQYIGDYRLELAKKLISNEHYKINTISELCGYASASYFTKVFRASTNLTPVEYRKMIMK